MKTFLEIVKFEIRLQLRAPLFWVLCFLLFFLHFIAQSGDNINLGEIKNLININSPYQIILTSVIFAYISMLPLLILVVSTMTRDHELQTSEFFFVAPIKEKHFLLGRYCGALLLATTVAAAGQLGSLAAEWMPWIDPDRLAPFSLTPYMVSFFVFTLPFVFVVCTFFFAVASLTRSQALTFASALVFLVLIYSITPFYMGLDDPSWTILFDPSGTVALTAETRYWSVTELNNNIPASQILTNRLLWIVLAVIALTITLKFFRFQLRNARPSPFRFTGNPLISELFQKNFLGSKKTLPEAVFVDHHVVSHTDFSFRGQIAQCASQLAMDMSYLLRSPLLYLVLLIVIGISINEHNSQLGIMGTAGYPTTSTKLDFFRLDLFPYTLMLLIYFAGELVHRDRETRSHEMIAASPYPDWLMPVSKILSLWLVLSLLYSVSIITSVILQALAGYTRFELGLYIQGVFFFHGAYFYLACVLAVTLQILSPNKWLGMSVTLGIIIFVSAMPVLGLENLLYQLLVIPSAVHSDMNGFAEDREKVISLVAYWGVFCMILGILSKMFFPRGVYSGLKERLSEAGSRMNSRTLATSIVAGLAFFAISCWIYYNTHILNEYQSTRSLVQLDAQYERLYGQYKNRPSPDFKDITLRVDIFPEELKFKSSAQATLVNLSQTPINEFVLSINPQLDIEFLQVEQASLSIEDTQQGFYLITLESPLLPNQGVQASWELSWSKQGFSNTDTNIGMAENGTFLKTAEISFLPGYDNTRELTNNDQRSQFGLPPIEHRFPALGDPKYLNTLQGGVSARADGRIILSTSADQIAITSGVKQREWLENGRRYFDYHLEQPAFLGVAMISGRFEVATKSWLTPTLHNSWNDAINSLNKESLDEVEIEIYYHPEHAYNIDHMMSTAGKALDYYTQAYGPYLAPYYRIIEIPRFHRTGAQAFYAAVAYSESAGFINDISTIDNLDFVTLHELAHQWWGGQAYGAYMQGRELLNEGLAQYSTYMMYKQHGDPELLKRILADNLHGYLAARSDETKAELPVIYTEDQGYVSYNKAASVMFALQDLIGADKVNLALRTYLEKFSFQPPPFPTSRDLVNELRAVAGEEYQDFITDQFEKIMFYDLQVHSANAVKTETGYNVNIEYSARQFEADGLGNEQEVPLDSWFDVVIFPQSNQDLVTLAPLYQEKFRIQSGNHSLNLHVDELPGRVGVDPFHLMIDRTPGNNIVDVSL